MITYKEVNYSKQDIACGYGRVRKIYSLSPEIKYPGLKRRLAFVCADYANTFDRGPETMLFHCDSGGMVLNWAGLGCWSGNKVSDDSAIEEFVEKLNKEASASDLV